MFNISSKQITMYKDSVIKENDHAMDSMRYFCYTVLRALDW